MVQGPLLLGNQSDFRLLTPSDQAAALKSSVQALGSEHTTAWIEANAQSVPAGYTGFAVVPRFDQFGIFRLPVSLEGWQRAAKDWELSSPSIKSIKSMEGHSERFNPNQFAVEKRTLDAFDALQEEQGVLDSHKYERNPLRVFPVRATLDPAPALGEDEFVPDLATLTWVLAAHAEWRSHGKEILLRCRGERFNNAADQDIVVGYHHAIRKSVRLVDFAGAKTENAITLIGKMPVI